MERLSISAPVTLMAFWYGVSSTSQAAVRPVVVVVAAISSTTANRLVFGVFSCDEAALYEKPFKHIVDHGVGAASAMWTQRAYPL
jgi:hypothetical protein